MRNGIQTALRLVYPPRCISCGELVDSDFGLCGSCWAETPFIGGTVCDSCGVPLPGPDDGERVECDECLVAGRPWHRGRAALLYRDNARRIVLGLKHSDRQDLVKPAAQWMARAARPLVTKDMLVAPIPLHWLRLLGRRYNQAAFLSREVARILGGLDHYPDLLVRPHQRGTMDGLTAEDRHRKMKGAIVPHPKRKALMAGRPVLLVDDVMTSGATLTAAANACLAARAKEVCVVTLARVAKDT